MTPAARLGSSFALLEDRALPSTFGIPWADPDHLTLSFASDGTQTPLGTSSLSRVLASAGTTAAWKTEILRAYQTWAALGNVNLGLVADGGQAVGAIGAVQGDSRFGDIRIAAAPLSSDVLASASPFTWTGTTLSGDVILNSNVPFNLGGTGGKYDLFSVAVHEAGHSFGLGHADEDGSAVHEGYSRHTGLSADDIADFRDLYGARQADAYDRAGGNDTAAKASAMERQWTGQLLVSGDISTGSDVDFYKFTAPPLTAMLSNVTVRLKASGISLLTAGITVYDSAGRAVTGATTVDPLNNDLLVSFKPGLFGGNYTVKVEGARDDAFGIGGYKLAVDMLSVGGLLAPITTTLTGVLDGHTDDTLLGALGLSSNPGGNDARFDAVYRGVIEDTRDVDSYRIRTDKFAAGTPVTLNAMVWGLDANPVDARVRVYDANRNPVSFQVLANDRGLFSVQVLNATAGKDYYVQVLARDGAVKSTGSYFFAADFNTLPPMTFDAVTDGTVAAGATTAGETLALSEAGVFQFALNATGAKAGDSVAMTVYDEDGNAVFTLTAVAGQPTVTATKYLKSGKYTVKYTGAKSNAGRVGYSLFLAQLSDDVGPYTTSTASPSSSTKSSSGSTAPPPSSSSTTSGSQPSYTYSGSSATKSSGYGYGYSY